jgi:hypothetical protein
VEAFELCLGINKQLANRHVSLHFLSKLKIRQSVQLMPSLQATEHISAALLKVTQTPPPLPPTKKLVFVAFFGTVSAALRFPV